MFRQNKIYIGVALLIITVNLIAFRNKSTENNTYKSLPKITEKQTIAETSTSAADEKLKKPKSFQSRIDKINFDKISNSIWTYKYSEESADRYTFKSDSTYSFYSAELGETFYGKYEIENDTIYAYQLKSEFDNELSEKSRHNSKKELYLLALKEDRMIHLSKKLRKEENWNDSNYKFPPDYIFERQ